MVDSLEQKLSSLSSAAAGRRTRGFSRWHAVRASQGALPSRHSSVSEPSPHELHPLAAGRRAVQELCCCCCGPEHEQNCGNLFRCQRFPFFLAFTIVGDRLCHVRVLGLGGGGARAREGRSEAKMDLNHHLYEEAGTPDAGDAPGECVSRLAPPCAARSAIARSPGGQQAACK